MYRRVRLVEQCEREGDVVRSVMKVDVSLSFSNGGLDVLLRSPPIARHGKPNRARAGYDAAPILGVRCQISLDEREGLVVPAEVQENQRHLIRPEWQVRIGFHLFQDPQGLLVLALRRERIREPSQGVVVTW